MKKSKTPNSRVLSRILPETCHPSSNNISLNHNLKYNFENKSNIILGGI